MRQRIREVFEGHFGALLVVLMAALFFQMGAPDDGWARLIVIVLHGVALVLALLAADSKRWKVWLAVILAGSAIIGSAAALGSGGGLDELPARLTALLLIATAPVTIALGLVRSFRQRGVTIQMMFGVLCLYLFIGLLFSGAFAAISASPDAAFFAQPKADDPSNFLYFSFATLTTVGYGDLTAGTDVGRSLAILEALLGQIYMVTVVALIVGNLGRRVIRPGAGSAADPE